MIDPHLMRRDPDLVARACARRGQGLDIGEFRGMEDRRKGLQTRIEAMRAERNAQSKRVGELKREGADASGIIGEMAELKRRIEEHEQEFDALHARIEEFMLGIPNILDDSVPPGAGEESNPVVGTHLEPTEFPFKPKDHVTLGEGLGMLDLERAVAMAGNRFAVLRGPLARLQRALTQFMLDKQTGENGYEEIYVPVLVNPACMTGTGQLPKFEEDLFRVERDGLYLSPTAEVPVTNFVRDRILDEDELPLRFACHAPCFRREAGSYGKDTRGMLRQHQFEKVELVHVTRPEDSAAALGELLSHAESVLKALALPYRVVTLCEGDTGFAARKTHDIEVWLPGQGRYREISSCSNCGDFQARRMGGRFRGRDGRVRLVHTLNGSGIAVGRALIAVMENHQREDGSIAVPEVLRPHMGGAESVGPPR